MIEIYEKILSKAWPAAPLKSFLEDAGGCETSLPVLTLKSLHHHTSSLGGQSEGM